MKTVQTNVITTDELIAKVREAVDYCDQAKVSRDGAKIETASATAYASRLGFTARALGIVDQCKAAYLVPKTDAKGKDKMSDAWKNIKAAFSQGAAIADYLLEGGVLTRAKGAKISTFTLEGAEVTMLTRNSVSAMLEGTALETDVTVSSLWKLTRDTAKQREERRAQRVARETAIINEFFERHPAAAALIEKGLFAETLLDDGSKDDIAEVMALGETLYDERMQREKAEHSQDRGRSTVQEAVTALENANASDVQAMVDRLESIISKARLADIPTIENHNVSESVAS